MTHPPDPKRAAQLTLLAIAAAGSSAVLWRASPDDGGDRGPAALSRAYYLDDAELIGTDIDGSILYRVQANEASQAIDDESIEMTDVRMLYEPAADIPWKLRANRGRIPPDGNIISLEGDVVVTSRRAEGPTTIIRTTHMDVDPAARLASTDQPVEIEYDGRIVNATGMNAELETNRLDLLSNVNGKFTP